MREEDVEWVEEDLNIIANGSEEVFKGWGVSGH